MFKQDREIIDIIGFRDWLVITLKLDAAWRWCERVYFCHHNARVIEDFEDRMCSVIYDATDGRMSKPYYTREAMSVEITAAFERQYNEGYEDGQKDSTE